ncbi:MAG TPA: hypothetical protein VGF69_16740 [Thermoanaerobaculia bacterium]
MLKPQTLSRLSLTVLCVAVFSCASKPQIDIVKPDMALVQVAGAGDVGFRSGAIDIQFALQVQNRSDVPITLRTVTLSSLGTGGAYRIISEEDRFAHTLQPRQAGQVTFWSRAVATSDRLEGTEPVRLRLVAYFESPKGQFTQILTQELGQFLNR